jgi:hypothetical protein
MKRKFVTVISILVIAALSACGPAPTPTLSPADIGNTAIANAWVAMTLTQAAMPTATQTPVPPQPTATFVPQPTFTLFPTIAVVATLPDTSAINPCDDVPPVKPLGAQVKIRFLNKTEGSVNLSFGMVQENSDKECGTYTFVMGKYDEPEVTVLAGCYWGYGWVTGDKPSTPQTSSNLCVTDTGKTTSIWITPDLIAFH